MVVMMVTVQFIGESFGVIATVAYAEVVQPDAFQKVVLQVISLTEQQRIIL